MDEPRRSRRALPVLLLVALLAVESAALVAIAMFLTFKLLVSRPDSLTSAVAILVLDIFAAVWVGAIALHALHGRPWIRGAALTWQILQIALGIGSLQAPYSRPDIGWLLILPAVAAIILLFTPRVRETFRRPDGEETVG